MNAPHEHRTRTLWLAGVLHAFTHIYHVALLPLYFLIRDDFQLAGVGQATAVVTVMMVAYFLPSYLVGVLADRFNRKHLLSLGLALNGLGFIGLAEAPDYRTALGFAVVAGLGGSFFHPSATAMIARLYPVGTGRALGLFGIGAAVGFLLGPIYTGWRAEMLAPMLGPAAWRRPVFELGVFGLITAALFHRLAVDDHPAPASDTSRAGMPLFPTAGLRLFFIAAAFAFGLRDFTGFGMGSLGSLFFQRAHGFSVELTGKWLSVIFLAASISNPVFGGLSDRGRIRWTALVLGVSAGLVLLFPLVPAEWTFLAYFAYGFFFMGSYPMVEAALMEAVPDAVRGRVFGFFITIGGITGNLSHWLMGEWVRSLGDVTGRPGAFAPLYATLAACLLVALLGLPCLHAIRRREITLAPPPARTPAAAESR